LINLKPASEQSAKDTQNSAEKQGLLKKQVKMGE